MSPCMEKSIPLTEQFSSYTSSPTSPFSEPFPNPHIGSTHPFAFNEAPPSPPPSPPMPSSSNFLRDYPHPSSNTTMSFPLNLEASALNSQPCISSSTENCLAPQISPKYPSQSLKQELTNLYPTSAPSLPQSSQPLKSDALNFQNKFKEDETLKLLKKYYLEALLAQQMDNRMPFENGEVSYKILLLSGYRR